MVNRPDHASFRWSYHRVPFLRGMIFRPLCWVDYHQFDTWFNTEYHPTHPDCIQQICRRCMFRLPPEPIERHR